MKKIVVTGSSGLLGWHATTRLHARNCAALYEGKSTVYEIVQLNRTLFNDQKILNEAVADADLVLHFSGINRLSEGDTDKDLEEGNALIASALTKSLEDTNSRAVVVYANSVHSKGDTSYGIGKKKAADIFLAHAKTTKTEFVDVLLPHIFGEGGLPFYNNVTGTLCHQIVKSVSPEINPKGVVSLLHAGAAAEEMIALGLGEKSGQHELFGREISIQSLYEMINGFHVEYTGFQYPDSLQQPFELALFNTYRQHLYPSFFPRLINVNADNRGILYEAAKGGGGGQTFISTTEPGVTRGEHFHLNKVERFLVLQGRAKIQMRRVLTPEHFVYEVDGDIPSYVDMPTLWTHNIKNIGSEPLVTLFWTNEMFNPESPDTYADTVEIEHE